jgi:hypothetical protein
VETSLFFGAPARLFLLNQQAFATLTFPVRDVSAAHLELQIMPDFKSGILKVPDALQNIWNSKMSSAILISF